MKELLKKGSVVRSSQNRLDFSCIFDCLINRPLGEQASVDHEKFTLAVMERSVSEPVDEIVLVFSSEDIVNGVFWPERDNTLSGSQQEEVMISQDRTHRVAEILDVPQCG